MPQMNLRPVFTSFAKAVAARFAFLHRHTEALTQAAARAKFDTRNWTPELLKQLEWRRFEELCVAYYQALGFTTHLSGAGADGSVDIVLQSQDSEQPFSVARCKAWDAYRVGTKAVKSCAPPRPPQRSPTPSSSPPAASPRKPSTSPARKRSR